MTRSYVVGLPVVVTVDDHGDVYYEVDTSETDSAIFEDNAGLGGTYTEAEMLADQATISADHMARHVYRNGGVPGGWLTLGEFRARTAHLSGATPITADGQGLDHGSDWYNVELDDAGIPGRNGDAPPPSVILGLLDTFDTRQW